MDNPFFVILTVLADLPVDIMGNQREIRPMIFNT